MLLKKFAMKFILNIIFLLYIILPSMVINGRNQTFFPNLPYGEYRLDYKGIYKCKNSGNTKIQFNLYLNKTSSTSSVVKGNFTNTIPIDDTLFLHYNFEVKDSIGRWQENVFTFTRDKACSTYLSFIKKKYFREFGMSGKCPEPVGHHIIPGVNTANVEDKLLNVPKSFVYGTYKARFSVLDKNKDVCGCFVFLVEIKRPWEMH